MIGLKPKVHDVGQYIRLYAREKPTQAPLLSSIASES
jgi:hypothetical protein